MTIIKRKYKLILASIAFLLFSILESIISISYNIASYTVLGVPIPLEWLIGTSVRLFIGRIFSISLIILLFGTLDLKNRFKRYKSITYGTFILLGLIFFMFGRNLISLILITITGEILPFSLDLEILYTAITVYISGLTLPISFIIFGLSNRKKYGNYIISSGIMGVMGVITFIFSSIFIRIEPSQFLITNWTDVGMMVYYALDQLIWAFLLIFSSAFLLFFSIRIKNNFFILYTILFFAREIYDYYIVLHFEFQMELESIILMLLYIFSVSLGILFAIRFFELGKRFKRGLRVFVSHSVDDFKRYRVGDLVKFLEGQKNISRVFYCESDLSGNIDEWMHKIVPRCQLLIFMSTEQSIVSNDCMTEINLAKTNSLRIVPVLGVGLVWSDLKGLGIDREYGTAFDPMEFEHFCNEVYDRIIKYKTTLESTILEEKKKSKNKLLRPS